MWWFGNGFGDNMSKHSSGWVSRLTYTDSTNLYWHMENLEKQQSEIKFQIKNSQAEGYRVSCVLSLCVCVSVWQWFRLEEYFYSWRKGEEEEVSHCQRPFCIWAVTDTVAVINETGRASVPQRGMCRPTVWGRLCMGSVSDLQMLVLVGSFSVVPSTKWQTNKVSN